MIRDRYHLAVFELRSIDTLLHCLDIKVGMKRCDAISKLSQEKATAGRDDNNDDSYPVYRLGIEMRRMQGTAQELS
ncbi:hypothetical protein TWF217_001690 [Orbilia oligospora]|nr:hypothetical protein TWF217_001690 [Orbilia oligospora]KAF3240755.1 hypothetical protein TWF128_011181 [Orbilia oligospora]